MANIIEKIRHNEEEYLIPQQAVMAITLPANGWNNDEQTVTATGVTANNTVIISPVPTSMSDYTDGGVYCTSQGADSLTFVCSTTPSNDIEVTVVVLSAELNNQPTPPSPWTPGADTIAYREFDGDLTDTMGNYDGTPYNFTCNYVALPGNPGKECLNYSTNWGHIDVASSSTLADVFLQQQTDATFSIWWNPTTFTNSRDEFLIFYNSNGAVMQFAWYQNDIGWQNSLVLKTNYNNAQHPDGYTWIPTAGTRYNLIMTYDTTTKEKAYYVNGQLVGSLTAQDYKTASSSNGTRIYESAATGYMSNMIIEKKCWTSQEVSNYFDGTKAYYGIS